MSDIALFVIGFVVFAFTSSGVMWFGYQQFNKLYRSDLAAPDQGQVLVKNEDDFEFRVSPERATDPGFNPIMTQDPTQPILSA
jgi:hypothetical protein